MTSQTLSTFIDFLAMALQFLIVGRAILSWVRPHGAPTGPIAFVNEVTDPILRPFQRLLPPLGGIDFSPILALVSIQVLQTLAHNLIG